MLGSEFDATNNLNPEESTLARIRIHLDEFDMRDLTRSEGLWTQLLIVQVLTVSDQRCRGDVTGPLQRPDGNGSPVEEPGQCRPPEQVDQTVSRR